MRALIISHGSDNDGYASAAIVGRTLTMTGYEVAMVGVDYDAMPTQEEFSDLASDKDLVFVCDFTLPPEIMESFGSRLVWIDHHHTAIEESKNHGYGESAGIREVGTAACALAFRYMSEIFTNIGTIHRRRVGSGPEMPPVLAALAKWDVHSKDDSWESVTLPIQHVCVAMENELRIGSPNFLETWNRLLDISIGSEDWSELLRIGGAVVNYQRVLDKRCSSGAHTMVFTDFPDMKFVAINGARGSGAFSYVDVAGYDGMVGYTFAGDKWSFGLYGWDNSPDLSPIATAFGGGGHQHACGFRIEVGEFSEKIRISPLERLETTGQHQPVV